MIIFCHISLPQPYLVSVPYTISAVSLKSCLGSKIKPKKCSILLTLYTTRRFGAEQERTESYSLFKSVHQIPLLTLSYQPLQQPVLQVAFRKCFFLQASEYFGIQVCLSISQDAFTVFYRWTLCCTVLKYLWIANTQELQG